MHFGKTSVKYECHTTHLHVQHVSSSGAAPCNHAGTHLPPHGMFHPVRSKSPPTNGTSPPYASRALRLAIITSTFSSGHLSAAPVQRRQVLVQQHRVESATYAMPAESARRPPRRLPRRRPRGHQEEPHDSTWSNMHSSMSLTPDLRASLRAGHSGCAAGLQKARWAPPRAC